MEKHSRWEALLGVMFLLMLIHNVGVVHMIIQYPLLKSENSWKYLSLNRSLFCLVTVSLDIVA